MTQARSSLISLSDTAYYHCISRCVRRAYLCGQDDYSGRNFEHRRVWVIERLRLLSQVFAIDICAYAIMSNHYHLVLHVDEQQANSWSDREVVKRWGLLYQLPALVALWQKNELMSDSEYLKVSEVITMWRQRLMDISWFMRNMNEYIARQANKEDQCTGRFWEGRFKSQALLDERALLTCMAYVDLNPVRAGMTETLTDSEYTSIHERIHGKTCNEDSGQGQTRKLTSKALFPFLRSQQAHDKGCQSIPAVGIDYSLLDYIELVECLGKIIRPDKVGYLTENRLNLRQQLGVDDEQWQRLCAQFGRHFCCAVGGMDELRDYAKHTHRSWVRQPS